LTAYRHVIDAAHALTTLVRNVLHLINHFCISLAWTHRNPMDMKMAILKIYILAGINWSVG
jgi:hypothetical protein